MAAKIDIFELFEKNSKNYMQACKQCKILKEAGFTTYTKIAKAKDEELLAIKGIGPKAVETLRKIVKKEEAKKVKAKKA